MLQCYSYLYQMREQLQVALQNLDASNFTREAAAALATAEKAGSAEIQAEQKGETARLRALIIKTAGRVQAEMDTLAAELKGSYVAQSEFGAYLEQISLRIEADPSSLTQYYSFASDLEADIRKVDSSFESYKNATQGYIRTGIVRYEEDGTPVYGVAVGQGLIVTETDGETVVDSTQFRSVFTSAKLSFYQADGEVAYLSNNRLYVTNITVLGEINVRSKWQISGENGFTVKWIGG